MRGRAALVLAIALCLLPPGLHAQGAKSASKAPPKAAAAPSAAPAPNAPLSSLDSQDNGKPVNIQAEQGIEWQQNNHVYIARGRAKATRGDSSVTADTLYAYYRPAPPPPAATAASPALRAPAAPNQADAMFGDGSTQIYRMEADGNVVFATPTETVYGDHAVDDIDQAVLVVTGKHLKLVTPRDTVTARDSLEWYDQKQLAVARGDAMAVQDQKAIRADVLTAEIEKGPDQPATAAKPGKPGKAVKATPAAARTTSAEHAPATAPDQGAHIHRINAQGHVVLSGPDQIAHGDSGVYNLDTGIATLTGNVTLTRGQNELRGQYGVVDMNRNISRLLSAPPSARLTGSPRTQVSGLLVPRSARPAAKPGAGR